MNIPKLTNEAKDRIHHVLLRATEDIDFRNELLSDPESALATCDLTPDERRALGSMRRVALEEWGIDVRRFRAFLRDNGAKISSVLSRNSASATLAVNA